MSVGGNADVTLSVTDQVAKEGPQDPDTPVAEEANAMTMPLETSLCSREQSCRLFIAEAAITPPTRTCYRENPKKPTTLARLWPICSRYPVALYGRHGHGRERFCMSGLQGDMQKPWRDHTDSRTLATRKGPKS